MPEPKRRRSELIHSDVAIFRRCRMALLHLVVADEVLQCGRPGDGPASYVAVRLRHAAGLIRPKRPGRQGSRRTLVESTRKAEGRLRSA